MKWNYLLESDARVRSLYKEWLKDPDPVTKQRLVRQITSYAQEETERIGRAAAEHLNNGIGSFKNWSLYHVDVFGVQDSVDEFVLTSADLHKGFDPFVDVYIRTYFDGSTTFEIRSHFDHLRFDRYERNRLTRYLRGLMPEHGDRDAN